MLEALLFLAALIAAYCGFAFLAIAMARHWRDAMGARAEGRSAPRSGAALALRIGGCLSLLASLLLTVRGDGPSFGSVLWAVLLSVAALAVVATLAWRPGWLRLVALLG